ncbi:hypothetical protein [Streptomyces sp. CC228A]|uniref:hypothetical protein n=1 Tax=Streptomyces sp. CC228A TaxID=2898186 RepID=UPI001F374E05|nr:hypothetical protein [Streptomyces sp. CC228A]
MGIRKGSRGTGSTTPTAGSGGAARDTAGCLLTAAGATTGAVVWTPRAAFSIDGGFEAHARDLSVVFVDLPLIVLGGAAVPLAAWMLGLRWTRRPWAAGIAAVAAIALGVWGLTEWWTPRQHPDPGYGPGI